LAKANHRDHREEERAQRGKRIHFTIDALEWDAKATTEILDRKCAVQNDVADRVAAVENDAAGICGEPTSQKRDVGRPAQSRMTPREEG
jgi:hypothetical protein